MQKEELAMYLTNMYAGSRTYTFEIKSSASFGVRDLAITEETMIQRRQQNRGYFKCLE